MNPKNSIDLGRRIILVTEEFIYSGRIIHNQYINNEKKDYALATLLENPFMTHSKNNHNINLNEDDIYLHDVLNYNLFSAKTKSQERITIKANKIILGYENDNNFKNLNREKYLLNENGEIKKQGKIPLLISLKQDYKIFGYMHVEEGLTKLKQFPKSFIALTNSSIQNKNKQDKIKHLNYFNLDTILLPLDFTPKTNIQDKKLLTEIKKQEIKTCEHFFQKSNKFTLINGKYVEEFNFI